MRKQEEQLVFVKENMKADITKDIEIEYFTAKRNKLYD